MDGRREGANRLVVLSEIVKRGHDARDDTFISCESPVGMLGLCWEEQLSSQQYHQSGQQLQFSCPLLEGFGRKTMGVSYWDGGHTV